VYKIDLLKKKTDFVFDFSSKSSRSPKESFPMDLFNPQEKYVLLNTKKNEALLPTLILPNPIDALIALVSGSAKRLKNQSMRLEFKMSTDGDAPKLSDEWLADAKLVILKAVPAGSFSKTLRIVECWRD